MKVLVIIPARYGSTRFPGKPLADLGGKPMIQLVFEQVKACSLVDEIFVATDYQEIFNRVESFGGKVFMTSETCLSGTDRCAEVLRNIDNQWDVVLNVQGDEPFIEPGQLEELITCMQQPKAEIGTLIRRVEQSDDLFNPNVVKVVKSLESQALYFSRNPIPFVRDAEKENWIHKAVFYRHIGLYAFRPQVLQQLSELPPGRLEMAESLEQLRWMEAGHSIFVRETAYDSPGIDTPEDLEKARNILLRR